MPVNNFDQILNSPGVDITGSAPENRVTEYHVLNPPRYRDRHFLVPLEGPFFANDLRVFKVQTADDKTQVYVELTEGVDYVCTHKFAEASYYLLTASPPRSLYASITFFDPDLIGHFRIEYQKLGGVFMHRGDQILALVSSFLYNPRAVTYEQIAGLYVRFPPTNHPTDANTIEWGTTKVEESLSRIYDALMAKKDTSANDLLIKNMIVQLIDDVNQHGVDLNEIKTAINFYANHER